jgi:hypothetical protein
MEQAAQYCARDKHSTREHSLFPISAHSSGMSKPEERSAPAFKSFYELRYFIA